jgi:hypothetical protein
VRAFATPWPASRAIVSTVKLVVQLREVIECCPIADAQSGPMPVLKIVNKPLPLASGVGVVITGDVSESSAASSRRKRCPRMRAGALYRSASISEGDLGSSGTR